MSSQIESTASNPPPEPKPRKRRWFRFRLWFVMLVIIPLAACLGWVKREANIQRRALDAMRAYGAYVTFESNMRRDEDAIEEPLSRWGISWYAGRTKKPTWLEHSLGPSMYSELARSITVRPQQLALLRALLSPFRFRSTSSTDSSRFTDSKR